MVEDGQELVGWVDYNANLPSLHLPGKFIDHIVIISVVEELTIGDDLALGSLLILSESNYNYIIRTTTLIISRCKEP